jgi:FHA domain
MIWVEILSRNQEIAARFRLPVAEARIGRGYNNDVIVDDPYVAPEHLRLFRDEAGQLVVEDLGSANGVYLNGSAQRLARIIVDGKEPIRIGRTFLRIREGSFAVAPERLGGPERRGWPIVLAAVLSVLLLGLSMSRLWLGQTSEVQPTTYLAPLLSLVVTVLAWAGLWALLSRVFSGASRFLRNLLITLTGAFAISLYGAIAQFVAYALTWSTPVTYNFAAIWLIGAVMCFFHLTKIGPPRLWLKGSILATLLVAAVAVQALQLSETYLKSGRQNTPRLLFPPSLRIAPLHEESAFFGEIAKLKAKHDEDRTRARPEDPIP